MLPPNIKSILSLFRVVNEHCLVELLPSPLASLLGLQYLESYISPEVWMTPSLALC